MKKAHKRQAGLIKCIRFFTPYIRIKLLNATHFHQLQVGRNCIWCVTAVPYSKATPFNICLPFFTEDEFLLWPFRIEVLTTCV